MSPSCSTDIDESHSHCILMENYDSHSIDAVELLQGGLWSMNF